MTSEVKSEDACENAMNKTDELSDTAYENNVLLSLTSEPSVHDVTWRKLALNVENATTESKHKDVTINKSCPSVTVTDEKSASAIRAKQVCSLSSI